MKGNQKIMLIIAVVILLFPVKKTINGWGMVVAPKDILVRSTFRGVVENVDVDFGADVKKGQPLLKLLLIGTPDDEFKSALTKDTITLRELNAKESDFANKKVAVNDVDYMKLEGDIGYLKKEMGVLSQVLGGENKDGQMTYEVLSPIDGKVHLLFPKANVGSYLEKNDDLIALQDQNTPKKLLCVLDTEDQVDVAPGEEVGSVPILNWKDGVIRMKARVTGEKLNRDQLESYMAEQPQVFDALYKSDGSRREYSAFLADDLQCDRLGELPSGMMVNIALDQGFTVGSLVLWKWAEKGFVFLRDLNW